MCALLSSHGNNVTKREININTDNTLRERATESNDRICRLLGEEEDKHTDDYGNQLTIKGKDDHLSEQIFNQIKPETMI